jgi:hypothetical protein
VGTHRTAAKNRGLKHNELVSLDLSFLISRKVVTHPTQHTQCVRELFYAKEKHRSLPRIVMVQQAVLNLGASKMCPSPLRKWVCRFVSKTRVDLMFPVVFGLG